MLIVYIVRGPIYLGFLIIYSLRFGHCHVKLFHLLWKSIVGILIYENTHFKNRFRPDVNNGAKIWLDKALNFLLVYSRVVSLAKKLCRRTESHMEEDESWTCCWKDLDEGNCNLLIAHLLKLEIKSSRCQHSYFFKILMQ